MQDLGGKNFESAYCCPCWSVLSDLQEEMKIAAITAIMTAHRALLFLRMEKKCSDIRIGIWYDNERFTELEKAVFI